MYGVPEEKSAISLTYREAEAGVMKSGSRDQREDSEDSAEITLSLGVTKTAGEYFNGHDRRMEVHLSSD